MKLNFKSLLNKQIRILIFDFLYLFDVLRIIKHINNNKYTTQSPI